MRMPGPLPKGEPGTRALSVVGIGGQTADTVTVRGTT